MAICTFNDFGNVSGTIAKKVRFEDGKKVVTRFVAQVRNGKQRIYRREYRERTTMLSQKEIDARTKFKEAAEYCNALTPEQIATYQQQFVNDHRKIGKKKYATLRGYIIARYYKGAPHIGVR